jgi:integrase
VFDAVIIGRIRSSEGISGTWSQQKVSMRKEAFGYRHKKCDCADQRRCSHGWVVRHRANGRQRERTFRHNQKTLANDFVLKVEHDKRAGVFLDPKAGDISLSDYAERWIRQHHGSERSKRNYAKVLRNHIKPAIGDVSLRKLTREQVRDLLLETMPKSVGHSVIVTARTLLVAVMSEAVRSGRIPSNPASGIRIPANQETAEFIVPTRKQLDALADALPEDWRVTVWLIRGCGLRIGEALAVSERRLLPGILRVSEQVLDSYPPRIGPLKHRKPGEHRDVPLPSYVAERLEDHIMTHGTIEDGYLFRGRKTLLPRQNGYRNAFAKSREGAGLPAEFT